MKSHESSNDLTSLRDEITALAVVKCGMSHERVLQTPDSMPVVCRFPEGSYKRVGLCTFEVRANRLGCSHTMARIKLKAAIEALESSECDRREPLANELHWLDNQIHLLDHRKGEAEKNLATVLETNNQVSDCAPLRKAAEEIRELEQLHDVYVERIGGLRDKVVAELDKLISAT